MVGTWPPTTPAGTTPINSLMGGGQANAPESGGGIGIGPRIWDQLGPDKAGDFDERYMAIRWRDDRSTQWSNEIAVDLGKIGIKPMTVEFKRLGVYRARQWEFVAQSAVPLIIVVAEEEAELLGS